MLLKEKNKQHINTSFLANILIYIKYFHQTVWHSLPFVCKLYHLSTLNRWKSNNYYVGRSIIVEHFSYFHRTVRYPLPFVCKLYELSTLDRWKLNSNDIYIYIYIYIYE